MRSEPKCPWVTDGISGGRREPGFAAGFVILLAFAVVVILAGLGCYAAWQAAVG